MDKGSDKLFETYRERDDEDPRGEPPADLVIRGAVQGDLDALGRIAAAREGGSLQRYAAAFGRALADDPDSRRSLVLVAAVGGEVVGYGKTHLYSGTKEGETSPPGWYLSGVVVDPRFRRRDIGARLTVERLAWIARRSTTAYYFANARNRVSIALHAPFGFTESARGLGFCGVAFRGGEGILFSVDLGDAPLDPGPPSR